MKHEKQPKHVVDLARRLRKKMTLPERLLWNRLKPSVNGTFDIRRQHPLASRFVVDFFYPDLQIAFEIDGLYAHEGREVRDAERQRVIEATGVMFIRIPARWALKSPDEVAQFILDLCAGRLIIDDLDDCYK